MNNTNEKAPIGASALTDELGMAVTGSVSFAPKLTPNLLTAMDFGSLLIGDGCMVITFGGQSITQNLNDVEAIRVRLRKSAPNRNTPGDKGD